MSFQRYLVTAALPYANGPLHIGHLAGAYIPADIYVRHLRLRGLEVKFICGSDEHGVPITIKAKKEGVTPQQVVDKYHKIMGDAFREFGISFDIYSRTSNKIHHETSSEFFRTLYDKNVFTEEETEQYYDENAKQFLADRYIVGTCPKCKNENAYGDQCEKCGTSLSPSELINPRSTLSGEKPVKKKTKNWYLPLDKFEGEIKKYIESHPEWKTNVYGQCQSWLKEGLKPRAMTRDLDWGVKVPVKGAEGKVLYVWFDAPIGYISATKEYFEKSGSFAKATAPGEARSQKPEENWEKYWKSKDSKLVHFIGKDNIVFHCIIFPAMLMAHGGYTLADNVPANEFLNLEGDKISTSRNWAVWLHEYLQDFPGKQDELRYVLTAIAPETKDSDFYWKYDSTPQTTDSFQAKVNNELVAIFGNFVNRAVVLTHKFYGGKIPAQGILKEEDRKLFEELNQKKETISRLLENFRFREAQSEFMNAVRAGNKYLTDREPWKLVKTDPDRTATIIHVCLQFSASLGILCSPFLPFTSGKIKTLLNMPEESLLWKEAGKETILSAGTMIGFPLHLFQPIEDEAMDKQIQKLKSSKQMNQAPDEKLAPAKPEISIDDFSKIDIRTGTILEAEKVPKADKLLKLLIDTGLDKRIVVSGIAEHYNPEEIIGKQVSIIANLAPRKLRGIDSQGMILLAENPEGKLVFVSPVDTIEDGSIIK